MVPFECQLMITLLKMIVKTFLYLIYPIRDQEDGCSLDLGKEVVLTRIPPYQTSSEWLSRLSCHLQIQLQSTRTGPVLTRRISTYKKLSRHLFCKCSFAKATLESPILLICLSVCPSPKPPNSLKSIIPPYHNIHHHSHHHTQHHNITTQDHHSTSHTLSQPSSSPSSILSFT